MSNRIIYIQDRAIVAPGDLIAEGDFSIPWSPYIRKINNKFFSTVIGLVEVKEGSFYIIPLEGTKYIPRVGDTVIGIVSDIDVVGWELNINSPYQAFLQGSSLLNRPVNPGEELRKYLDIGDYVIGKVDAFDRTTDPLITVKGKGLGRIPNGVVIDISPNKIPRVIGKGKAMINSLSENTGCDITIAQNGRLWAKCPSKDSEDVLVLAIRTIETESHIKGLTDRIIELIKSKVGSGNGKA